MYCNHQIFCISESPSFQDAEEGTVRWWRKLFWGASENAYFSERGILNMTIFSLIIYKLCSGKSRGVEGTEYGQSAWEDAQSSFSQHQGFACETRDREAKFRSDQLQAALTHSWWKCAASLLFLLPETLLRCCPDLHLLPQDGWCHLRCKVQCLSSTLLQVTTIASNFDHYLFWI